MSMLSDLKIERKLMAAFAVVIAAIAIMGVTVFVQVNAMETARTSSSLVRSSWAIRSRLLLKFSRCALSRSR